MDPVTPSYRPDLIEDHAADLYVRAHTARPVWAGIGALAGIAVGAAAAMLLPAALPLPARLGVLALVAAIGAFAGLRVGTRRAKTHRVRAQLVLADVHAQYGTLAVWRTLQERLPARRPAPVVELTRADVSPEIAARVAAAVAAAAEPPQLSSSGN
jgi:hypothetical protein